MARIIYVEDDEVVGELVKETLMNEGHAVGVIPDGETALKVIGQKRPDLIILDAGLPMMGGLEVLSNLKRTDALYQIPVLMLTGRRSKSDEQIAFFTGATEYLRKPFDPEELVMIVDELLKSAAPKNIQENNSRTL